MVKMNETLEQEKHWWGKLDESTAALSLRSYRRDGQDVELADGVLAALQNYRPIFDKIIPSQDFWKKQILVYLRDIMHLIGNFEEQDSARSSVYQNIRHIRKFVDGIKNARNDGRNLL